MITSTCLRPSLLPLKFVICALLLFGTVVAYSPTAFGQGATGAINGTVTDSTGAVIPNVKITLTNDSTGSVRLAVTNATGTYVIPEALPGTYSLTASAEGFATAREDKFTLNVNQTATHNFTLSVGTTKQEVTVSATATHIESSTAELGTAVASREVNDLPLNGRNFTQLLQLTPGVSPISTAQNAGGGGQWGGNTIGNFTFPSVNGQCNRCNYFLLDGFNDGQVFMGMVGTTPIIDGMQEFKVQSHNDSSAYGGALGGIVNVATKAGSNQYHGDVWEFLRNNALDAANFFENTTGAKTTPYKQNQFGGVIGGPLVPHGSGFGSKTWFYAGYEGFRSVRNNQTLLLVPTPAQLAGDLSTLPGQIYNPFSTTATGGGAYTRQPFMCDGSGNPLAAPGGIQAAGTPCNKIPSTMINQQLLSFMTPDLPPPNAAISTQTGGTSNAADLTPQRIRQDTASLRFDHNFSEHDSAWLRYTGFTQPDAFPYSWPGSSQNLYEHGYQLAADYTHVFSGGAKVLTVGFGRNSQQTNQVGVLGVPANLWQTAGFSPAFAAQFKQSGQLNPAVGISGFNTRPGAKIQDTHMSNVYEWKGDFTWVHGRHTFQMGGDFATNNTHSPIEYINEGFNVAQTSQDGKGVVGGQGLASFLLGVADTAQYRNVNETTHGGWVDGFYFQDSWKATDKLTVNIGLRYDLTLWPIYGSLADKNQWVGDMDLDTGQYILARNAPACNPPSVGAPCIPGGTLPANVILTPHSNNSIYNNTYDNLGPRVGLAYRLRPETVLRGAYGKFFDNWGATSQLAQNYEGTWPSVEQQLVQQLNYPTATNLTPNTSYGDPFGAATGSVPLPPAAPFGQLQWFIDPRVKNAYSEQWNLGIQQSLGRSTVLEADYVGQHSSRLNEGGLRNVAVTPGPGDPTQAVDPRRPYPYITPTFYDKSIGKASYNAFQFKIRRTSTKGLSYIVSYTWSKIINLGCDGYFGAEGCSVQQVYNLKDDRSVAGFDVPMSLSTSWTYDLPFGKGMKFNTGNKAVDAIIGPWAFNGIFSIRSGEPTTLGVSGDIANIGGNTERPNAVGSYYPADRTWQKYINTSSFTVPAAYTFGTLGRNALRLGDASNWDISIFRDFPIPLNEATRLQFRAEFFNAFNHAVLGGCLDTTVQDANFGVANCTRNDSREIQFALKFYF